MALPLRDESSPGSFDECSMSASQPLTFVPSRSASATDLPKLAAAVTIFAITTYCELTDQKLILILPSNRVEKAILSIST